MKPLPSLSSLSDSELHDLATEMECKIYNNGYLVATKRSRLIRWIEDHWQVYQDNFDDEFKPKYPGSANALE